MPYSLHVIKIFGNEYYTPATADSALQATGWVGGKWVRFKSLVTSQDAENIRVIERVVEICGPDDPVFFLRYGNCEPVDQYTSLNPGQTGVVTCGVYGQFLFKYYETLNKAERNVPGSGASLVYVMNSDLYVSENGLLTSEKETVNARSVGICIGLPATNSNYLGVFIGY